MGPKIALCWVAGAAGGMDETVKLRIGAFGFLAVTATLLFCSFWAEPAFAKNPSRDADELVQELDRAANEFGRTGQVQGFDPSTFSDVADLLKNALETSNTTAFQKVIDSVSKPDVLNLFAATQSRSLFSPSGDGVNARYLLQILQAQKPAELKRALLQVEGSHGALMRFQSFRSPADLELALKLDHEPSLLASLLSEPGFDLVGYLTGKLELKEELIVRALFEITPQSTSLPSIAAEKFLEQIRFRGGLQGVISGEDLIRRVARRVFEQDSHLLKRASLSWISEAASADLSLRRSNQAKLRTSALNYLLKTGTFSLRDFDRMISEMKQGARWNEAFLFGSSTVPISLMKSVALFRTTLRNSLTAAGYPGVEGFARYLAERHGLALQTVTSNWESAKLTESSPGATPIEAWRLFFLHSPGLFVEFTNQSFSPSGVRLTVLGRQRSDREHTQSEIRAFVESAEKSRGLAQVSIQLLRCEALFNRTQR